MPPAVALESSSCPSGYEFVTVIGPSSVEKPKKSNDKRSEQNALASIPRIIHVASPTNCLPIATSHSLKEVAASSDYAIYIHSDFAMDRFILARRWEDVFPEAKDGAFCTAEKVKRYVQFALEQQKESHFLHGEDVIVHKVNATSPSEGDVSEEERETIDCIAEEIAIQSIRDIWKYLLLWEYGGIVIQDLNTLHAILDSHTVNDNRGTNDKFHRDRLLQLMAKEGQDAILFWNVDRENDDDPRERRVPVTQIMAARPHHPLVFFTLKWALKWGTDDIPVSFHFSIQYWLCLVYFRFIVNVSFMFTFMFIFVCMFGWLTTNTVLFLALQLPRGAAGRPGRGDNAMNNAFYSEGRVTDIPPLREGLIDFLPNHSRLHIHDVGKDESGNVISHTGKSDREISFVNGNGILPRSLLTPSSTKLSSSPSWRPILKAMGTKYAGDNDDDGDAIVLGLIHAQDLASKRNKVLFSCMELRLRMHS